MLLAVLAAAVFGAIFLVGYLPRKARQSTTEGEARRLATAAPAVTAVRVERAATKTELSLPGNIQAITEAAVLARADGYLVRRLVDIGDRVKTGQLLAEIDSPELDQQVFQAEAALQQAEAALGQARASLEQAKANAQLADVTLKRNRTLVTRGVLSKQEGDQSTANFDAQIAAVRASEANVNAAQQNVNGSKSNLKRLRDLQGFKMVRAPFSGVITLRNVDTGALINTGSTLLFRIAQIDPLRIFINVPQSNAGGLRVGQTASIEVQEFPGKAFEGKISRISGALDTSTRTLLTEVQVANRDAKLLPGMYAQARIVSVRTAPPVMIPGEALVLRSNGTQVAVVGPKNVVHYQPVTLGRDYGTVLEVLSGLEEGQVLVANPSDQVRDGVEVNPTFAPEPSKPVPSGNASKRAGS